MANVIHRNQKRDQSFEKCELHDDEEMGDDIRVPFGKGECNHIHHGYDLEDSLTMGNPC